MSFPAFWVGQLPKIYCLALVMEQPRSVTNLNQEFEEPGTSTCSKLTKPHEPFQGKQKRKERIYLDIHKFYVPALKPTLSIFNAFAEYSSKAFGEEWPVSKFNMEKQHDASGNDCSLSCGKSLTLIDCDIHHGGKYSKPVII